MTDEQQRWIRGLAGCTFLPGSFEKRFVRDMAGRSPETELTEKQAAYLHKLAYRYRKQRGEPNMAKPTALIIEAQVSPEDLAKLAAWNEGKPL